VPEQYRWALLLADVEELSYQEVARVMDCPVGTVMSRVNRGRRTLARLLRRPVEGARGEIGEAADVYERGD
jgi:RNA polymerase sigma-70 factor (ECF subfamily)